MHPPTHFLFAQTPVDRRHVRLQSEHLARRYALRALHSPAAHDLATDKTGEHYFLKPLPVDWTREHSLMDWHSGQCSRVPYISWQGDFADDMSKYALYSVTYWISRPAKLYLDFDACVRMILAAFRYIFVDVSTYNPCAKKYPSILRSGHHEDANKGDTREVRIEMMNGVLQSRQCTYATIGWMSPMATAVRSLALLKKLPDIQFGT
ncbi:hypothetical protein A0H81_08832 [Grifola frondosa]|uniref:Uncharacterized protein n=1 Tax=Grifola frondosa TaxID=5627 RepID=A0A1C7M4F6_GRIFR|nr:hypothetical protein A0H81_08832 [Grifola frondosa]